MKISPSHYNFNIPKYSHKVNTHSLAFRSNNKDSFEMSIGYVNDIHGQTNNMIRILSGFQGDLRLSAGDNDIGNEEKQAGHKATAQFLRSAHIRATALGNHDFDTTQGDFINTMTNVNTDVLSLNIHKEQNWENKADNLPEYDRVVLDKKIKKSVIVDVKGEKIGLIGTSPAEMFLRVTRPYYHTDCYIDDVDTTITKVQEEVNELKKQGVNKIFVLSHLGQKSDQKLAQNIDGVDVIVGGHTHELVKGITKDENLFYSKSGEPVILTEAGKDGHYFGLLNLTFDKNGVITKAQNNIAETRVFHKNMINQYMFNQILGTPEDIGIIQQAPPPPKTLIEENPHANFVCDAMKNMTNSDISIWNNSGIRNFFHEGSIDSYDIKSMAPFNNKTCVAMVSEKDIVDDFKESIKATYETHGYKPGLMAVSGLNYTINQTTHELVEMNFVDKNGNETKIDINNPRKDKFYKVVTDQFMMCGEGDYKKLADFEGCLEVIPYDKDVLVCQYIKQLNKPIVINQTGRIKFIG